MLDRAQHLDRSTVTATDGVIGHVKDVFFDEIRWTIRYLVIDTGHWLSGREVLVSPYAVKPMIAAAKNIDVRLTLQQVTNSPRVDSHRPVSRQLECEVAAYYGYPEYWGANSLWAAGGYPYFPVSLPTEAELAANHLARAARLASPDGALRSAAEVTGYAIHATDGSIGHVSDFIFDNETWAIRYLVVETRNWWPGGKSVLIGVHWIGRIDWAERNVHVTITLAQVRSSPIYDDSSPVHRDYEARLHSAYDRTGYWD